MIVSKSSVKQFVKRSLRNSEQTKSLSAEALDDKLREFRPHFHTEPRIHQKVATLLGLRHPNFLFLLDPGLGKTKVTLDLIRYRIRHKKIKRALVLVPGTVNVQTWRDECSKHAPDLLFGGVDCSGAEARLAVVNGPAQVVVITYMGWLSMVCDRLVDEKQKPAGWEISKKLINQLAKQFQFVVWDECTMLMNHTSMHSRAARRLIKYCPYRYGLTGTPMGGDVEELWNQFYCVDRGKALGETLGIFRAALFKEKSDYWSHWPVYVFDEENKELLHSMICHSSVRYREEECADLPKLIRSRKRVVFSKETWAYYHRLVEELKEARGNFTLLDSVYIRMRQLSSGYLSVKDPENDSVVVTFKNNPKLESLIELIREVPKDRKIFVYNEYKKTGEMICNRLKKEKIKHLRIFSKTSNKSKVLRQFIDDARVQVLVGSSSVAYGPNLQCANYLMIYESPSNPKTRKQVIKRLHRMEQKRRVFVYDLVVKGSIDEKILRSVKHGRDLHDAVIEGDFNMDE